MKISGSIFVSKNAVEYAKKLKEVDVDFFHLDFTEREFRLKRFNQLNFFDELEIPLDVHLICSSVTGRIIKKLNASPTKILTVQYENLDNIKKSTCNLKKFRNGFGFAISPNTDVNELLCYKNMINHILVMCSTPGVSGAKFLDNSFECIKKIKKLFPNIPIYVDGGINREICMDMDKYGVSIAVLGSYLYNNIDKLSEIVLSLKNKQTIKI